MKVSTTEEIAALYRVTTQTVRWWARQGKIRAVRIGRAWRFDGAEIEALLAGRANKEDK